MAYIGQVVEYNTTEKERKHMIVSGSKPRTKLPAIITHVIDTDSVNLHVILDGEGGSAYIAPSHQGTQEGQWNVIVL